LLIPYNESTFYESGFQFSFSGITDDEDDESEIKRPMIFLNQRELKQKPFWDTHPETTTSCKLYVSLPKEYGADSDYYPILYLSYLPRSRTLAIIVEVGLFRFLTVATFEHSKKDLWFELLANPEPVINYPLLIWSPRPQSSYLMIANLQLNRPQVCFHVPN
jgi:hypothetical protein